MEPVGGGAQYLSRAGMLCSASSNPQHWGSLVRAGSSQAPQPQCWELKNPSSIPEPARKMAWTKEVGKGHPTAGSVPAVPMVPELPWPALDPVGQDTAPG